MYNIMFFHSDIRKHNCFTSIKGLHPLFLRVPVYTYRQQSRFTVGVPSGINAVLEDLLLYPAMSSTTEYTVSMSSIASATPLFWKAPFLTKNFSDHPLYTFYVLFRQLTV